MAIVYFVLTNVDDDDDDDNDDGTNGQYWCACLTCSADNN